MPLALYMDHHVPYVITEQLRARAVDVLTAGEGGRAASSDPEDLQNSVQCLPL